MAFRGISRIGVGALTVSAALLLAHSPVPAPTADAVPAGCAPPRISVALPAEVPIVSWAESLTRDDAGNLWVSRTLADTVQRYDASGRLRATVSVPAPGAVRPGPDGRLYVTSGATPANMIPGTPDTGTIVAFDPRRPQPVARTIVRGLGMPNGLAIAADGAMYVADSKLGVVRIRPEGTIDHAWTARAPRNLAPSATVNGTGMNGIVLRGDAAYVTMTSSLSGRVLRVPLHRPEAATPAVDLTAPLPGFVDDLAVLADGSLAAATTTGQIIVATPGRPGRCVIQVGRPVTAVLAEPGGNLLAASETGEVLALRWPAAA